MFLGASRNPGEWLTVLEATGRAVFFFVLWIPLAEALKRKQGRMEPAYVTMAHRRYDEGGVCSQAVFCSRFARPVSELLIRTDQQQLEATVDQILGVVR